MRRLAVGLLAIGLAVLVWLLFFSGASTNTGPLPPGPGDWTTAGDLPPLLPPGTRKNPRVPAPTGPPGYASRLDAPGWVLVRARESGTNRPVVLAGVTVEQGGVRSHFKTSRDGTVWVGPVEPGVIQMHFAHGRVVDRRSTWFVYPAALNDDYQEIIVDLVGAWPVSGKLVTTEGKPGRGQLTVRPLTPGEGMVVMRAFVPAAKDGTFTSSPLPPGRYEIILRQSVDPASFGYVVIRRWQVQAGDADLVLEYEPRPEVPMNPIQGEDPGELVVRLVTADGGMVRLARVQVIGALRRLPRPGGGFNRERPLPVEQLVAKGNTFCFKILRPGELVWIAVTGATATGSTDFAPAMVGPLTLSPGTRDVLLTPGQRIAGRVLTAEGEPLADCAVHVSRSGQWLIPRASPSVWTRTDPQGRFQAEGLGEGTHRVDLRNVEEHLRESVLSVAAGTEDLVIRLRRGVEPRVRVLDESGDPVVGARVLASSTGGAPGFGHVATDWDGVARLPRLDPEGTYLLEVADQCSGKDLVPFLQRNWKPEDTTLRLPAAAKITGTVVNEAGEPLALASVVFRGEDGRTAHDNTRSHGFFELRVPAGAKGFLSAYPPGTRWQATDEGEIPVTAGDLGVVFRCAENTVIEVHVANWPPGAGGRAVLSLPGGLPPSQTTVRGGRGVFLLERLPPGRTGTLEVCCPSAGLAATIERVSTDVGRVEVSLTAAQTIEGWLELPEGAAPLSVVATKNYLNVLGRLSPNGRFTIPGLTPGTWTVVGRAFRGETVYSGEATVEAGERVEIMVTPEGD